MMRVVLFFAAMVLSEVGLVYWLMTAYEIESFARRLGGFVVWFVACIALGVWFLP